MCKWYIFRFWYYKGDDTIVFKRIVHKEFRYQNRGLYCKTYGCGRKARVSGMCRRCYSIEKGYGRKSNDIQGEQQNKAQIPLQHGSCWNNERVKWLVST